MPTSTWAEAVLAHEVWERLAGLRSLLNEAKSTEALDPHGVEILSRLEHILSQVDSKLRAADPLVLEPSVLDALNKRATLIEQGISQFIQTKDAQHLTAANATTAPILASLSHILVPTSPDDVALFGESVTSFRRSAAQLLRHLSSEVENVQLSVANAVEQINGLKSATDAQKARVDEFIAQTQTQATANENQRTQTFQQRLDIYNKEFAEQQSAAKAAYEKQLEDLEAASAKKLAELQVTLEQLTEQFESSQSERDSRLTETLASASARTDEKLAAVDKLLKEQEAAGEAQRGSLIESASGLMSELESHRDKALDLVGLIATTSVTGGYQRIANQEQEAARLWRRIALASFVAFASFALYAFFSTSGDSEPGFSLAGLLRRLFVSGSLLLVGGFAAREAAKHQVRERHNRQQQLRLEALDPFLESLDDAKRAELKERLVDGFFASNGESTERRLEGALSELTPEQLKLVVELFRSFTDKAR